MVLSERLRVCVRVRVPRGAVGESGAVAPEGRRLVMFTMFTTWLSLL